MNTKLVQNLLKPIKIGDLTLSNKLAMASLTRLRCDPKTDIPNDLLVQYYSERASAGLLLSEASPISKSSLGVQGAGSHYTQDQVKGWKKVTDAVHAKGGRIFAQLWHQGRSSHAAFAGEQPIAPSALKIRDPAYAGPEYELPREMSKDDIKRVTEEFARASENARQAGFDGVEVHGANGYLIDEFLRDGTNQRKDEYGGSLENRVRFPLEVIDSLIKTWGKDRVGIKISPVGRYQDMYDSDPVKIFGHFLKELDKKGIAYVQIVESDASRSTHYGPGNEQLAQVTKTLRPYFKGPIMMNVNLTPADTAQTVERGAQATESGEADLVSFGRLFISNPDLVERIKNNWSLAKCDPQYFYWGGAKGYIDYPTHGQEKSNTQ